MKTITTVRGLLKAKALRPLFQPIVDLDQHTVVGYEALARGPAGGRLEHPLELFAAARAEGLLAELDAACRRAAVRGAAASGRLTPLSIFVNVEPEVVHSAPLQDLRDIALAAPRHLPLVFEISARGVAVRPAEILRTADRIREYGWAVALDDVGGDLSTVTFMSLLRPEVVKLDLALVQQLPDPEIAAIMHAVNAYTEESGGLLLVEGIETDAHLDAARGLGARLGQGWLFGAASDEPSELPIADARLVRAYVDPAPNRSPFACLATDTPRRRGAKRLLIQLSKRLEEEALVHGASAVVASTFQAARHFTSLTAERYRWLDDEVSFVCVFGEGLSEPIPGVRGAELEPGDPLTREWDVIVLTPHFAAALLARDLDDSGPDLDRCFEYALTYRRDVVVRAALALLSRVAVSHAGSP